MAGQKSPGEYKRRAPLTVRKLKLGACKLDAGRLKGKMCFFARGISNVRERDGFYVYSLLLRATYFSKALSNGKLLIT